MNNKILTTCATAILLAGTALYADGKDSGKTEKKPNIIFIMADDLGYGDVQCYNSNLKVPTPNINKLATQGMLFTDAHTSASICTPSRYGVLTGRYCWRTRLKEAVLWTTFDEPLIEKERMTIGSLAKKNGYQTACIGKWHLGMNFYKKNSDEFARGKTWHEEGLGGYKDVDFSRDAPYSPNDLGFDFSFISGAGHNMEPHCFIKNRRPDTLPTEWREENVPTKKGTSSRESHEGMMSPGWSDENVDIEFAKQAVQFIERTHEQTPDKPFLIYLTPVTPHRPCVPTEEFQGKSGGGIREDCIMVYDSVVGEVMKTLEKLGIADNTLIMVTSDNGPAGRGQGHRSAGEFRQKKGSIYEGGHRVPFIARWPKKIEAGSVNNDPMCLAGLLATMAEMFDEKLPATAGEDSVSFLPNLYGKANNAHDTVGIVHIKQQRYAIRLGDWKLIPEGVIPEPGKKYGRKEKVKSLFNLKDDPYEKENVYTTHPEIVERLSKTLEKYKSNGRSALLQ